MNDSQVLHFKNNAEEKMNENPPSMIPLPHQDNNALVQTVQILSSWCTRNQCSIDEIPQYLQKVHSAVLGMSLLFNADNKCNGIDINNTIHPDYIICLEDGKKLKTLKRHLFAKYGMTLTEYKRKWGLGHDYPTVAPNYALRRSNIAKQTSRRAKKVVQHLIHEI